MTIRLHDYLSSGNGYKVRLLLTQLGIPFERIEYDITRGETRTPEFLENVNANGRIPVLETEEGVLLPESNAILFYLAESTPFLPDDHLGKARALQWMFFEANPRSWQNARAWIPCVADGERYRPVGTDEGVKDPEVAFAEWHRYARIDAQLHTYGGQVPRLTDPG
jgi:glutathione S-transferase